MHIRFITLSELASAVLGKQCLGLCQASPLSGHEGPDPGPPPTPALSVASAEQFLLAGAGLLAACMWSPAERSALPSCHLIPAVSQLCCSPGPGTKPTSGAKLGPNAGFFALPLLPGCRSWAWGSSSLCTFPLSATKHADICVSPNPSFWPRKRNGQGNLWTQPASLSSSVVCKTNFW